VSSESPPHSSHHFFAARVAAVPVCFGAPFLLGDPFALFVPFFGGISTATWKEWIVGGDEIIAGSILKNRRKRGVKGVERESGVQNHGQKMVTHRQIFCKGR